MQELIKRRIENLQNLLRHNKLDGVLIIQPENRLYYSGFKGSNGYILITPEEKIIITDSRYFTQVANECPNLELFRPLPEDGKSLQKPFVRLIKKIGVIKKLGFESSVMNVSDYRLLSSELSGADLVPCDELLTNPRLVKDDKEIGQIRKAVNIAEEAFIQMGPEIQPGVSEKYLSAALGFNLKMLGAEKESFDIIIGSGPNGAMPHAQATEKLLGSGETVVIDWGAILESGYNSDMTRTLFVGSPDPEMEKIYQTVKKAQMKALDEIGPNLTTGYIDSVARDVIANEGYGEFFGHGLGHGVGLAIHEGPTLSRVSQTKLEPGMVVTVEPGIYIPGKGGVRIEDMVVITSTGKEIITSLPK